MEILFFSIPISLSKFSADILQFFNSFPQNSQISNTSPAKSFFLIVLLFKLSISFHELVHLVLVFFVERADLFEKGFLFLNSLTIQGLYNRFYFSVFSIPKHF